MIQGSVTLRRVCDVFRRNGPWLAGRGHFLYAARRSTLSRFLKYKIIAMVHNYGSKHIATSHTYWPTNRRTKGGFLTFDLATTGSLCAGILFLRKRLSFQSASLSNSILSRGSGIGASRRSSGWVGHLARLQTYPLSFSFSFLFLFFYSLFFNFVGSSCQVKTYTFLLFPCLCFVFFFFSIYVTVVQKKKFLLSCVFFV